VWSGSLKNQIPDPVLPKKKNEKKIPSSGPILQKHKILDPVPIL